MSYVLAEPQMMAAAATDVAAISSTVSAAHMAAAAPTVSLIPAAADQVSTGIAQLFSGVAQDFHALVGQAATFGQQFAQHLHLGAGSYTAAEAVSAASLRLPDRELACQHRQRPVGPDTQRADGSIQQNSNHVQSNYGNFQDVPKCVCTCRICGI